MRGLWLLAAVIAFPLPGGSLPGQGPGTWHVVNERGSTAVQPVRHGAYEALPLSTLVSVGAQVAYGRGTADVGLGAATVHFTVGSADFRIDAAPYRLESEVYEEGGAVYVPLGFFRDHLPRATGGRVAVDGAVRTIRGLVPPPARAATSAGTLGAGGRGAVFERVAWGVPDSLRDDPAPGPHPRDTADAAPAPDPFAKLIAGASGSPLAGATASGTAASASDASSSSSASPSGADDGSGDASPDGVWTGVGSDGRRGKRLVVVDAGHGGVDPGARGPGGTREKDVTLAVARRLAAALRRDTTLEVRMTRDRDTLIALRDRPRFANQWRRPGQPAVFISVHCNANPSRAAHGIETYFLSEAKTEDARRVEAMENAAERYESASGPSSGGNPLGFILHDLRQNQYLRESSDWAEMIDGRLTDVAGPSRGVRQAGFAVLTGAFMPAVLVEIGFVSNPAEEQRLTDPDHQDDIAGQLAAAVRAFLNQPQRAGASAGR